MEDSKQENQEPKLPQLEVFKTTLKKLAMMGITSALVQQPYPFDRKMLMPLLSLTIGVSFVSVYIVNYANTFVDYTRAFFMWAAAWLVIFLLIILIFKVKKLFEFVNRSGIIANASE